MDTMTESDRKYNIRLYPIYKMFSWDLLFYYSISFLFLTQTKGLTLSTVLFAEAFYPVFKIIFQIPALTFIDKVGNKKSLIIANLFIALSLFILLFATGFEHIIISNLVMAIGFCVKGVIDSNMLYGFIPKTEKRRKYFFKH